MNTFTTTPRMIGRILLAAMLCTAAAACSTRVKDVPPARASATGTATPALTAVSLSGEACRQSRQAC